MIDPLFKIFIVAFGFSLMEIFAWFTHKYIMHGFLWSLHKDHHKKDHDSFFEKNDLFFIIFAAPGIFLLIYGLENGIELPYFWLGMGISLYGISYFFFHDLFVHQRIKIFKNSSNSYLSSLKRAHKIHHKYISKENGENFGFLWLSKKSK